VRRILVGLASLALLGAAIAWSRTDPARPELDFAQEKVNPVTHLRLNNAPDEFQFAVVSDRTGGHRAKVFSRAVEQLNLLQPEFVVSVGDLIEGYSERKDEIAHQWREFQSYVSRLQMPFFYVPGNHDIANPVMGDAWREKFGRSYYEFLYKDVLFLALDTEDPPKKNDHGRISAEQLAWLKKVLDANAGVRWTFVFLHKPIWALPDLDKSGWLDAEKLLNGRKYTVFAGHMHQYQKYTRQGMTYYQLATTGGDSRMRGPEYGEVDHITWVTMKKAGPVVANVLLDGILREDLAPLPSDEEGVREYYHRHTHAVSLTVLYNGKPAAGARVELHGKGKGPGLPYADGIADAEGRVRLSTYRAFDGVPSGEYAVTVVLRKPYYTMEGKPGPDLLPAKYASVKTTPLNMTVKTGEQHFTIELSD
jgi:predicted phosphodiesterase